MTRSIACAFVALFVGVAGPASAQSYTLADIFTSIRAGEAIVGFAATNPTVHARINGLERYARASGSLDLGFDRLVRLYVGERPSYSTVLRLDRAALAPVLPADFRDSLAAINVVARGRLRDSLAVRIGRDSLDALYRPLDVFLQQVLVVAQAANAERLRKFAIKYGPSSPRLNLAEAGLNYLGQLVLPGVFLGRGGEPSPWEMVAAYRSTDLTVSDGDGDSRRARMVSSAKLGMRWYNFAADCGTGSPVARLRRPCHVSAGAFLMGPADVPLSRVTGAGARSGLYAALGGYHAGVVFGGESRLVFGVETHVLPHLF